MASSLSSQLQNIASLDATRLTSRTGAPSTKSYLFSAKVAQTQDIDTLYALGQAGFDELLVLDPEISEFEETLFSDGAKRNDRMLLNKEENEELDEILEKCLRRLGRWIGTMAGGKCIEWLIRRFRIHEMNTEVLIQVFLPYHDSPNFARMLSIITIPQTSTYYAPFSPLIKNAQPLPRSYIATHFSPSKDPSLRLFNDIVGMVSLGIKERTVHRALLAFWTGTLIEVIEKGKNAKGVEGMVKTLVEAIVEILTNQGAGSDVNAAVYPILILLTRSIRLADEAFLAILEALLTPKSGANPTQRVLTLLVLLQDRPGWTLGLGVDAGKRLAAIKLLGTTLVNSMEKYGFEEALKVIIPELITGITLYTKTLEALVESPAFTPSLVTITTNHLLSKGSSTQTSPEERDLCKHLLSGLRERHSTLVDSAYIKASSSSSGQVISSDLLVNGSAETDELTDIYSADIASRITGINHLFRSIDFGKPIPESTKPALITRLGDQDLPVIRAIYEDSANILSVIGATQYLEAITQSFTADKPDQEILLQHLTFIVDMLLPGYGDLEDTIFRELIFPNILCLGNRPGFGVRGWKLLKDKTAKGGLLQRVAVVGIEMAEKKSGIARNIAMIKAVSAIITSQASLQAQTDFLFSLFDSPVASSRILARMLFASLLSSATQESRLSIVIPLLSYLFTQKGDSTAKGDGFDIYDGSLHQSLFQHPTAPHTVSSLTVALLTSLKSVERPTGVTMSWLSSSQNSPITAAEQFKLYSTKIYSFANSSSLPPNLAKTLLRHLLTQLADEALLFLVSIWTDQSHPTSLRIAAIQHATAFVNAHLSSGGSGDNKGIDFQMVLPALLYALQDQDRGVREAGVGLLRSIGAAGKNSIQGVYALDNFYGERSVKVQILKPTDIQRYLTVLEAAGDDIVLDASRLRAIHATELVTAQRGRKEVQHRRAIITCLLSHVSAWQSLSLRLSILETISDVQDSSILRGVLPLLVPLRTPHSDETKWLSGIPKSNQNMYMEALTSAINKASVSVLADTEAEAWKFVISSLVPKETSIFDLRIRSLILDSLVSGVFDALAVHQKVPIITTLLSSLHDLESDDNLASKASLARLGLSPPELITILQELSTPLESSGLRKRQKQDGLNESQRIERCISDITVFVESRDWSVVPGNAPLVAMLMEVLSNVLGKRQNVKEGVDYLEQELLGGILALVEKLHDKAEVQKAHIGIEVIIKVIRASSNPRTSQRALLVTSELARLIPEAVLHNVMPIFTFMGASDFQRDDAYTFGVVEKTISRIVPVMTKNLKAKHVGDRLGLFKAAEDFLGIFTAMVGRLPKHRTLPFFVHLVKSLGGEFLPAIVILLVDRSVTTKGGKSASGVLAPMEVAIHLVEAFELANRLDTLHEVITESVRLVDDLTLEVKEGFLSRLLSDNDDTGRPGRQITALLSYTTSLAQSLARKPCDQEVIKNVVKQLIALSARTTTSIVPGLNIGDAVKEALKASMALLAAGEFLIVTNDILESNDPSNALVALNTFTQRLPFIKKDVRLASGSVVAEIIKKSSALLTSTKSGVRAALAAIRVSIDGASGTEDSALALAVPKLIELVKHSKDHSVIGEGLAVLDINLRHLGPRIIPYIQTIIDTVLSFPSNNNKPPGMIKPSFALLVALVETVPTFVSAKQLNAILQTTLDLRARDEETCKVVSTVLAKKVQTKVIFPVVMDLWKDVQEKDESAMEGFFHLLRLTLRNAIGENLTNLVKPVFTFFLDVFDLRHRLHSQTTPTPLGTINRIEESAIGSFLELVTKLSEATFKPLFTRLYDWAVVDLSSGKTIDDPRLCERKTVLLHVMMGLLHKFRHLLSPYIGIMMPHIEELLPAFAAGELQDRQLWSLLLQVLGKSFEVDDGAYWTDSLHLKLIPLLTSQLPRFTDLTTSSPSPSSSPLTSCLTSLASSTTNEPTLKALNTAICLQTRNDDSQIRIAALRVLEGIWDKQAEEMVGLVPETVSEFLAELLEDEDSGVESLARGVLAIIEKTTGSLQEYLE